MKKDKHQKCKICENCNKEQSNHNWIVCVNMPVSVMLSGTSDNCENFKELN